MEDVHVYPIVLPQAPLPSKDKEPIVINDLNPVPTEVKRQFLEMATLPPTDCNAPHNPSNEVRSGLVVMSTPWVTSFKFGKTPESVVKPFLAPEG